MDIRTKQVIVIRKDLNMRKGKIAAQAGHACMAFLTTEMTFEQAPYQGEYYGSLINNYYGPNTTKEILHWLQNSFRKICVYVNSQEELEEVHQKALDAGLISHLITDNGATEFNGVPTMTCCAIGPHWDSKFEDITNHLPLL